jgi:hypothetical protein
MMETNLANLWDSKLLRRLELLSVVVSMVLVCWLVVEESVGWIGWVIAGLAVLFLTATRWPFGALTVLIASSAMPHFYVEIFGWKARPEHFASAIVSVAVGIWLLFNKRSAKLEKVDFWVLAYVIVNFISSAFNSPLPSSTLRWALQGSLAIIPYFLMRLMVRDAATLRKTFYLLLGVGVVESIYGILCYLSYYLVGSSVGVEAGQYGDVAAPYGSLFEANLFGAYTACCAVLFLALYNGGGKYRLISLICFLVATLATILSYSRAALLALLVISVYVLVKVKPLRSGGRKKLVILAVSAVLVLSISVSTIGNVLQKRFIDLYSEGLAEDTTITRYITIIEALQDIPKHPLLGTGTSSLQLTFDFGQYMPEWAGNATWVGNLPVRVVHDTGILGLALLLGFVVSVWSKIRLVPRGGSQEVSILFGLWAGVLLYTITFQSTDGSMLALAWIHCGLLASAAAILSGNMDDSVLAMREPKKAD